MTNQNEEAIDLITLINEGPYTLVVELNGKEIIREHFENGGSEINHTYHHHRAALQTQAAPVDVILRALSALKRGGLMLSDRKQKGHDEFIPDAVFGCINEAIGSLEAALQAQAAPVDVEKFATRLSERISWLDKERRSGGDYQHLTARLEECQYILRELDKLNQPPKGGV